jgi:hypothetical protein
MKEPRYRLGVRFFKLTMPMGRNETGDLMERALIPKRIPLNLKYAPGKKR